MTKNRILQKMNENRERRRDRKKKTANANRLSLNTSAANAKPRLMTVSAADVNPKPLRWLVPDILPLGKLALLAGDGGLGKSSITIDLAARLSRGQCAFGLEYETRIADSLFFSCEDDPKDTIIPRLLAAGADRRHVSLDKGIVDAQGKLTPWSLAHHQLLDELLGDNPGIRLVIVDPASAFAGLAGIDGHKDAELRALLGPLTEVAARREVTIVLIAHLGKGEAKNAARRVLGSVAWINAVRAAWIVAEHEEEPGKRLLLPIKANLAPRRRGLIYQLVPLSSAEQDLALAEINNLSESDLERLKSQLFRVLWFGETDADADKVFAPAARQSESRSEIKEAADWLRERLRNGPVESSLCVDEGNAALGLNKPLKWWRIAILQKELQGVPSKDGYQGRWRWKLNGFLDSLDSLAEQGEQTTHKTLKIVKESKESTKTWYSLDAPPEARDLPF